jgi:hypothetical protein
MLYKFRSKAAGDVIMLGPVGDRVLDAMGREPAPRGILEPSGMALALQRLDQAIAEDEARRAARAGDDTPATAADEARAVPLRQRAWPLVEMIRRAQDAGEPIVWGV